jgi:hypothetical protein
MGTYAELLLSSSSFAHLLEDIHQHEQEVRTHLQKYQSTISSKPSETCHDDERSTLMIHIDTKQQGTVGWHVYASYIRAGFGSIPVIACVLLLYIVHQTISMYSSWWLAAWSEDETHRYQSLPNCTSITMDKIYLIRSMSSIEWNNHRNRRFIIYCST